MSPPSPARPGMFRNSLGLKFVAVAIAFLVTNGVFVYLYLPPRYEESALASLRREMENVSRVVGANLAPSLDFDDREGIAGHMRGLESVSEIIFARVTDAHGSPITTYRPARRGFGDTTSIPPNRTAMVQEIIVSPTGLKLGRLEVVYSLQGVFANSKQNRRDILVFTLLVIFANTAAMGLVSRQIARPLQSLTSAAQKISQGDFTLRPASTSTDEVGELTESFNVMSDKLLESRRLLEQHAEGLEAQVAERTVELSRKNEELLLQTLRAEEANRLKSEFLANMSHELRTPLSSIIGFMSLILEGICDDEEERNDLLKDAHRSSLHLLSLINYILDLTKIEAGRLEVVSEPIDVASEFGEVEHILSVQAKARSLELVFEIEDDLPNAYGDQERVRQVLINLVGNAIKFTSRGKVSVRAFRAEECDAVVLEVVDTGIGIPLDKQGSLFQKFTQVDGSDTRRYGGTGLGLALSKSLVELMNGRIGLSSEGEGCGTRVWFTLPLANAAAGAGDELTAEARAILTDSDPTAPLVLVVEDDPAFARYVSRVLRSGGFRPLVAGTADKAFLLAQEHRPIAMTVDLGLPHDEKSTLGGGADLVRKMKTLDWECRVIIVTGQPELAERDLAEDGALAPYPILRKPIAAAELLRHLEAMPQPRPGAQSTVLVADDDSAMARIVERFVRGAGTRVIHCENGVDAIETLRDASPAVDLMLLDLDMPEMDGFGVLRNVERLDPARRPSVLVVTNYPELATGEEGRLLKAGYVWGMIPKARLGEDPELLKRALARIARGESSQHVITHSAG